MLYFGAVALLLATLVAVYWLRIYRHPLLRRLSHHPEQLPELEPESLAEARRLLRRTRRLDTTLAQTGVSTRTLDQAVALATSPDSDSKPVAFCETLARRLQGRCELIEHQDLALFTLTLPDGFLLNLQRCLLVSPNPNQTPVELAPQLRRQPGLSITVEELWRQPCDRRAGTRRLPRDGHQADGGVEHWI